MEGYESRVIAQEETISQLNSIIKQNDDNTTATIATLQNEKEVLLQNQQKLSRELARLFSVDAELQDRINDIEKYKVKLRKAEEELQTKEFLVSR